MKCELCDLEARYKVWDYVFCEQHYKDLNRIMSKIPSLHLVRQFIKTNGTMKEDTIKPFYDKYVSEL